MCTCRLPASCFATDSVAPLAPEAGAVGTARMPIRSPLRHQPCPHCIGQALRALGLQAVHCKIKLARQMAKVEILT